MSRLFLEASMACVSGNPILNDEEFDQLKLKLKIARLCVRVQGAVSVIPFDNKGQLKEAFNIVSLCIC
ncbi:unnamed protein product [Brassica rapa subsp. narinosa]